MSAYWTSVEKERQRLNGPVRPVNGSRRPQALTFIFTCLQPVTFAFLSTIQEQPLHAMPRDNPPPPSTIAAPTSKSPSPSPQQVENIFIEALVQACSCQKHRWASPAQSFISRTTHYYHHPRRRYRDTGRQIRHFYRQSKISSSNPPLQAPLSRDECLSIVDWYREPFSTHNKSVHNEQCGPPSDLSEPWMVDPAWVIDPISQSEKSVSNETKIRSDERKILVDSVSVAGRLQSNSASRTSGRISVNSSPRPVEPLELLAPIDEQHEVDVADNSCIDLPTVTNLNKILDSDDCTHEAAFEAYSRVPFPGVSHLPIEGIRLLFHRLSVVEKKDRTSMLRYLSVVDDMKYADLPMTTAEWSSAISFCGQCFTFITSADMEAAILTWREMEMEAGVKGRKVTFNILFDMAAKAGKFVLAEMILQEMEARELSINRYAYVGFIFFNGLRGDGDGVRRAYRDFVDAGHVVDTVVLNCVIASLIRAGEPAAAENVYERMKDIVARHTSRCLPPYDWKETRALGMQLDRAVRTLKHEPQKLQELREEQFLAPNIRTFAIFFEHHVCHTGELRRVMGLLTDMQNLGVPIHGRIFLKIFKGFAIHGGRRYSTWTRTRLESVWNALLEAWEAETDLLVMKWLVIWTVRAFGKCAGKERTAEVWGELRSRWKPRDWHEMEQATTVVQNFLRRSTYL